MATRNYRGEYDNYQGNPDQIKKRAEWIRVQHRGPPRAAWAAAVAVRRYCSRTYRQRINGV